MDRQPDEVDPRRWRRSVTTADGVSIEAFDSTDWALTITVAIAGNSAPALLFALAQQRVESSVAGMLNAATPLAVLLVGIAITRRHPGWLQIVGLVVGFGGVATMAAANVLGTDAQPVGIALLLVAVAGYGLSNNVIVPAQQAFGSSAIVFRSHVLGALALAPFGLRGLATSSPTTESIAAVVVLGVVGTGIARTLNATLAGRIGAARGSLPTSFIPVVAVALGAVFRDDTITRTEIAGTVLVLAGAAFASRGQRTTAASRQ